MSCTKWLKMAYFEEISSCSQGLFVVNNVIIQFIKYQSQIVVKKVKMSWILVACCQQLSRQQTLQWQMVARSVDVFIGVFWWYFIAPRGLVLLYKSSQDVLYHWFWSTVGIMACRCLKSPRYMGNNTCFW